MTTSIRCIRRSRRVLSSRTAAALAVGLWVGAAAHAHAQSTGPVHSGYDPTAPVGAHDHEGPIGPGILLKRLLGEECEVVATVVCGDSYFAEHISQAKASVVDLIRGHEPDLVVAGPAFNAGRYGVACGTVAAACEEIVVQRGKLFEPKVVDACLTVLKGHDFRFP